MADDISRDIVSGDFAMHLLRPYPFFRFKLAESAASRLIAQIMDFIPGMVIYSLILFPHFLTPLSFIKYIPVVLLASMLNYLFSFILGLTAMSLKNNTSIIWLNDLLICIAGGAIIPMEFYPDWLNRQGVKNMNKKMNVDTSEDIAENIITVKDLQKTFKVHQRDKSGLLSSIKSLFAPHTIYIDAVKDINLTVKRGEIRGLIGPNGAGKSTTIKILSGILFPTDGTVDVLGYTPWTQREELVKRIGVVLGQKSQLWWDLPPIDAFALNKRMYEIPDQLYKDNLEYFSKALKIEDVIKKPVRQLSLGERMKCEFVAAMLHHPPLVFLDEPTIGLDMISKEAIRSFIKDVNKTKGVTFIVTTHDMGDIEDLCQNVSIINKGTIVYDGSIEKLHTFFADQKVIELKFSREVSEDEIKGLDAALFDPFTAKVVIDATKTDVKAEIARLLEILPVRDININGISIEEVIKQIYEQ